MGGTATHIGLVPDLPGGRAPMILHNIGRGAREEDVLLDWPITGRFRWKVQGTLARGPPSPPAKGFQWSPVIRAPK